MRLADKVIIVTGGGRGIGRAYARALAAEGAYVVVAADTADPASTAKDIEARGGQALGVRCDVSLEHDTLELATKAGDRFGRIDVLVNNAYVEGARTWWGRERGTPAPTRRHGVRPNCSVSTHSILSRDQKSIATFRSTYS